MFIATFLLFVVDAGDENCVAIQWWWCAVAVVL